MTSNLETWYFIHRQTTPNTYYEADDLLKQHFVYRRSKKDAIAVTAGEASYSMVPIPAANYVIIAATKLFANTEGTLTLTVLSTTGAPITVYVFNVRTSVLDTPLELAGSGGDVRVQEVPLEAQTEYAIVLVQSNTTMDTSLFVNTSYSGDRLPRHNAYPGGNGVTLKLSSSTVVAVGDYKYSARTGDFDGWLLCDGRAVYRDAYPDLFSIIGTSFGSGNGTTTFNLPDSRGRVCGMTGAGAGLTPRTLGQAVGTETHTLQTSELPSHQHTGTTATDGSHDHSASTGTTGSHQHGVTDAYFSENGGLNQGWYGTGAASDNDNHLYTRETITAFAGDHSHTVSVATAGSHTHTFETNAEGGGAAHNIMQPTVFIGHLFICAEV